MLSFLRQVVVTNVSGEINGESDAHDQVDQVYTVKTYPPPGHVPEIRKEENKLKNFEFSVAIGVAVAIANPSIFHLNK